MLFCVLFASSRRLLCCLIYVSLLCVSCIPTLWCKKEVIHCFEGVAKPLFKLSVIFMFLCRIKSADALSIVRPLHIIRFIQVSSSFFTIRVLIAVGNWKKSSLNLAKVVFFIELKTKMYFLESGQIWHRILLESILALFNHRDFCAVCYRRDDSRFQSVPPPPYNILLTKGSVHIVASRAFVEFTLYSEPASKFRDWVKNVLFPDETYFTSLNHNPHLGTPGAYLGTERRVNFFDHLL